MRNCEHLEAHLAVLAAAGVGAGCITNTASGVIQYSGVVNLPVSATFAGLYLNFVTGVTGASAGDVSGWDVNPWVTSAGTGSAQWQFFPNGNGANADGGVVGAAAVATNLPPATVIDAGSTFLISSGTDIPNGTSILGVRLFKEDTMSVHYGWLRISGIAFPGLASATLVDYAWEDAADTGIPAGQIPSPGGVSLLVLGAAGLAMRRRA